MKYHAWCIRLKDRQGVTMYSNKLVPMVLNFTFRKQWFELYETRAEARGELKESKALYPKVWRQRASYGMTAAVVKINVTLEEA